MPAPGLSFPSADCFACQVSWSAILLASVNALAAGPRPAGGGFAWNERLVWVGLAAAAAILCLGGAVAIRIADRWRKDVSASRLSPSQQLAHFRTLYQRGDLSSEEFERIRNLLQERLMQSWDNRNSSVGTERTQGDQSAASDTDAASPGKNLPPSGESS